MKPTRIARFVGMKCPWRFNHLLIPLTLGAACEAQAEPPHPIPAIPSVTNSTTLANTILSSWTETDYVSKFVPRQAQRRDSAGFVDAVVAGDSSWSWSASALGDAVLGRRLPDQRGIAAGLHALISYSSEHGRGKVDGFISNTVNYNVFLEPVMKPDQKVQARQVHSLRGWYDMNDHIEEQGFATALRRELISGVDAYPATVGLLLDTSRNGQTRTGALPNAPVAGRWFQAQFEELARNAFTPFEP